jgi:hypothetical protein
MAASSFVCMALGVAFLNRVLALVVQLAAFTCTLSRLGEPVGVERTQAHLAQPALGLEAENPALRPVLADLAEEASAGSNSTRVYVDRYLSIKRLT